MRKENGYKKRQKRLKNNKAPGLDNIPAELLKAGCETTVMSIKFIIVQIWETGEWHDDIVMSELITLPKVTGTFECDKHRTISLFSHAAKMALEVIRRVNNFIAPQIDGRTVWFGFRQRDDGCDHCVAQHN